MVPSRLLLGALAIGFFHCSLLAIFRQGPVSMELVSEQRTVVDGKAFWVGWRMVRDKGWHTIRAKASEFLPASSGRCPTG